MAEPKKKPVSFVHAWRKAVAETDRDEIGPTEIALANTIANHMNGEGFGFISDETLAEKMHSSVSTVRRARRKLRETYLLTYRSGTGAGKSHGRATEYRARIPVRLCIRLIRRGVHWRRLRWSPRALEVVTGEHPSSSEGIIKPENGARSASGERPTQHINDGPDDVDLTPPWVVAGLPWKAWAANHDDPASIVGARSPAEG